MKGPCLIKDGAMLRVLPAGSTPTVLASPLSSPLKQIPRILLATLFLLPTVLGKAQQFGDFKYTVNGGMNIIITGYTGFGGDVSIPARINNLPVAYINQNAFLGKSNITSIAIPSGVLNIPYGSFGYCGSLTAINVDPGNVVYSSVDGVLFNLRQTLLVECPMGKTGSYVIPSGVIHIAPWAFNPCGNLTSITIPEGVNNIAEGAFYECTGLTSITIPSTVTNIDLEAFLDCYTLTNILFLGNAPTAGFDAFGVSFISPPKVIYYLPGATGWGTNFDGVQTALWGPTATTPVLQNNQFGFDVGGPLGMTIVVEASTDLAGGWMPLQTNTMSGAPFHFSDPASADFSTRFYRLHSQ